MQATNRVVHGQGRDSLAAPSNNEHHHAAFSPSSVSPSGRKTHQSRPTTNPPPAPAPRPPIYQQQLCGTVSISPRVISPRADRRSHRLLYLRLPALDHGLRSLSVPCAPTRCQFRLRSCHGRRELRASKPPALRPRSFALSPLRPGPAPTRLGARP